MTKAEMISSIAEEHEITKAKAERIINSVFNKLVESIVDEGECSVNRFGSFKVVGRSERVCRNPQTGESMTVPAYKTVKFSCSKALKDTVNK